ncbi:MAG: hypothetical protein GY723_12165 [bacterium]|nr:hypothetical protein [bacterium]MCP5066030.1 hypothetical protein [bacterium]
MTHNAPHIMHGADVSYFSGKLRPAFAHKTLWMREVMPDILEIKRRTGMHYFPAVETPDGDMWQDTSDILDQLEAAHPTPPLIPASPVQRIVAYLIELYGDEMGQARVDTPLAGTGWEKVLALRPNHRVEKRNYKVVWESPHHPSLSSG